MPALLAHAAILLLARDRLQQVRTLTARMIERKRIAGAPIPRLEIRVNQLADAAVRMLNTPPAADTTLTRARDAGFGGDPDPFAGGISKFAMLGAMGPDLPAFAEVLRPGQGWAFDTVHKGTPDYNREAVIARTTDLALEIHLQALIKVRAAFRDPDAAAQDRAREREMGKVRAYVLGHLAHVAGDMVAHPFINDLEWHAGLPGAGHVSHGGNEAMIDAEVARRIFRRAGTRDGQGWGTWWPEADEVPDWLTEAWSEAFLSTYGTTRPPGFRDFETDLARFDPPAMSPGFLKSGVRTFRGLVVTAGYDWGFGPWFGLASLFFVPAMAAPLIAFALPHSRQFFEAPDDPARASGERQAFDLVTLPFQLGALPALVFGAVLMPFAQGVRGRAVTGLVLQALTLASLAVTAADSATAARPSDGIPAWARWLFLFGPPAVVGVVFSGLAIRDGTQGFLHPRPFAEEKPASRRTLLDLVNLLPLVFFLVFFSGILVFLAIGGIASAAGSDPNPRRIGGPAFWIAFAVHALALLGLWIVTGFRLRDLKVPETVNSGAFPFRRHAVRLFDDTTLFTDPAAEPGSPDRFYPSDIRPLARLWWTGSGTMQVRSERIGLTFRPEGGAEQTVPGPLAPMTVADYLAFLRETVRAPDGTTGGLAGAPFDAEARAAYLLPAGAAFAAFGDLAETGEAQIAAASAEFRDLGTADGAGAFTLYHAPKPFQAVKAVPGGTIRPAGEAPFREAEGTRGYAYLLDPLAEDARSSDAVLAKAGDLAALLCMGAADHMTAAPAADERIYQVFRNWSLDRRRVNEWRMLVEGGGLSDKPDGADRYDPAMPGGLHAPIRTPDWRAPVAAAGAAALAEAEATARGHGWVRTLRDWIAATEEGEDLLSPAAIRPGVPPNRALSRALAYILDQPDPAGGP